MAGSTTIQSTRTVTIIVATATVGGSRLVPPPRTLQTPIEATTDDASSLTEILIDTLIELYFLPPRCKVSARKLYFTAPETFFSAPETRSFPPENQTRLIVLFCVE